MNNNELTLHLKQLEMELLSRAARTNSRRLNDLIADEYLEIGKSGKIYTKQGVIEALKNEDYKEIKISGYKVTFVTRTVALAVYTAHHKQADNDAAFRSVRSSLWKSAGGKWQIIFHQGTPVRD